MAIKEQREEIFAHWNSKGIVVHRKLNHDLELELNKQLRTYDVSEIKEMIDDYFTILEPGVEEKNKKYYWTHRWNLYDFLVRGIRKFDGLQVSDYLKRQKVNLPEAVVFKRNLK